MNYTLVIHGAPASSQSPQTALSFAQAALARGHKITRVFLFREAVHLASHLTEAPQGEQNLHKKWKELADDHSIDMVVCISAALKRGMLDATEARRYNKTTHNIEAPFSVSGLGQLIDGAVTADQLVTFGD